MVLLFLFVLEIIVGAETFEEFVQEFGKLYRSNEEYAFRKSVFDRNVKDIALHNILHEMDFCLPNVSIRLVLKLFTRLTRSCLQRISSPLRIRNIK